MSMPCANSSPPLRLPPEEKARLMALTPATYVGLAPSLALREIPP